MIYCKPSDLVTAFTPTLTGATVDTNYPLTNCHDGNPIEVVRMTTTTAARLIWDLGSATTIDAWVLVMHNLAAAGVVTLQANTADSWGAPAVSTTVTVPTWPDTLPRNLSKDLRATGFATVGYRYISMLLPTQAAAQAFGEVLWINTLRQTDRKCIWRPVRGDRRRIDVNATIYGVEHIVERGVRQRQIAAEFPIGSDADRAALLALHRDARGMYKSWPIVLDPDEVATDEWLYGTFTKDTAELFEQEETFLNVNALTLKFIERQRGLPL